MSYPERIVAKLTHLRKKVTVGRSILSMSGIIIVGGIIGFAFVYTMSGFPIPENRLVIIANIETQLSGTLIGFMAIGLFYYLGVVHRMRDRFSRIQDTMYRRDIARLRGKNKKEAMTDWEQISLRISRLLTRLNGILIYSAVSTIFYFGAAIFLAITAIMLLSGRILGASLFLMIYGISNICFVLLSVRYVADEFDELLSVSELRNAALSVR